MYTYIYIQIHIYIYIYIYINPMDRGAWWVAVPGFPKESDTV